MNTVYYQGNLIPAEDWDYALSKPKTKSSKKESKKAEVELPQEVTLPEEQSFVRGHSGSNPDAHKCGDESKRSSVYIRVSKERK